MSGEASVSEVVFYTVSAVLLALAVVGLVVDRPANIAVKRETERKENDPEREG